jgi:hypothetical protein
VFFIGMFFGLFAIGLVYGAAIWRSRWWWIGRVLRDGGFGAAVLVRPNRSVQVWTASVGPVTEKDQGQLATAEQRMIGVITQWAQTRPLAGYSVAILMAPKGIVHVWTESQGIFEPGRRKWTCEERALLGRLGDIICGPRGVNSPIDVEDRPCFERPPLFTSWVALWRFRQKSRDRDSGKSEKQLLPPAAEKPAS